MKRNIAIAASVMLAAMLLAACGQKAEVAPAAADTAETAAEAAAEQESQESILEKDADGNFIKPENYGTVKKLGQYKGLEVTLGSAEVTDEEVENEINAALEDSAYTEPVDRAARSGDVVNIDYVGKKDGVAFDGGTAEVYDLELGSHTFIDGFEEGLIGAKKGDVKDLNLKFPDEYHAEELAGKDVVFTVTVNEVKEKTVPELTDDWVKEYTGGELKTADEFRKDVRQKLEDYRRQDVEAKAQNELVSQIIASSELEPSVEAIEYEYQTMIGMYDEYAAMMGVTTDEYLEAYGVDPQAMRIQLSYYAEESVKQRLMEDAIIKAEGLKVTDADKQALADGYGYSVEEMEGIYGDQFDDYVKSYMIVRYIYDNAVKK